MNGLHKIKSVNHRGYSSVAPENTMPAFQLSEKMGFRYVEADVSFTADGVAVLLHDATIDRTSDGKGRLSEMSFREVRQYDFGGWKSPAYRGTRIPTLEEFLVFCRDRGLYPYVELKKNGDYTEEQIRSIVDAVEVYELKDKASFISFSPRYLEIVKDYDPAARLGLLKSRPGTEDIPVLQGLRTGQNEVFFDVKYRNLSDALCEALEAARIPVEVWTVNDAKVIPKLHRYISGITSNDKLAEKILHSVEAAKEKLKG